MHHLSVEKCVMLLKRGDGRVHADVIGGPLMAPTCPTHRRRRIAVVHLKRFHPNAILYLLIIELFLDAITIHSAS
jgi:hypothetical protein